MIGQRLDNLKTSKLDYKRVGGRDFGLLLRKQERGRAWATTLIYLFLNLHQRRNSMAKDISKQSQNKKPNWLTDPSLPLSEKVFHFLVFAAGWIIFGFAVHFLWVFTHSTTQGATTVALSIVSSLLVLFSFFCIPGRGLQVLADIMEFSKKANHIKILGIEMHRSDKIIEKIMEQQENKKTKLIPFPFSA